MLGGREILVDAGPLVALLHCDDQVHAVCVEQAKSLPTPFLTSWAVLAEAAWLVRGLPQGLDQLLAHVEAGLVVPHELDADAGAWMRSYAAKYADLGPQLADLTLCYLAEREGIETIFTTDRRDFLVYRLGGRQPFNLLPAALGN